MSADADRPEHVTGRDFSSLPPGVRLDETIASVDPDAVPDPEGGRNGDQHRALRDD